MKNLFKFIWGKYKNMNEVILAIDKKYAIKYIGLDKDGYFYDPYISEGKGIVIDNKDSYHFYILTKDNLQIEINKLDMRDLFNQPNYVAGLNKRYYNWNHDFPIIHSIFIKKDDTIDTIRGKMWNRILNIAQGKEYDTE